MFLLLLFLLFFWSSENWMKQAEQWMLLSLAKLGWVILFLCWCLFVFLLLVFRIFKWCRAFNLIVLICYLTLVFISSQQTIRGREIRSKYNYDIVFMISLVAWTGFVTALGFSWSRQISGYQSPIFLLVIQKTRNKTKQSPPLNKWYSLP